MAIQCTQVLEIAGIGQRIQVDQRLIAGRHPVQDEVATNEAGTAGYQNHRSALSAKFADAQL